MHNLEKDKQYKLAKIAKLQEEKDAELVKIVEEAERNKYLLLKAKYG
jgi:hypothetical protein